ncbi:MAG: hypothetical protein PHU61_01470 [Candidatus Absconditabacteria bacterium]|nr:hypothetical protein [Candidatus Absconditabacteria bacterium]MDD3868031.1 hypothetical protein [Candidatus Absconditabacteria bacterium]MDD4714278.1 hypothetical protein [Candidatus Absconditabacteria bacterium]
MQEIFDPQARFEQCMQIALAAQHFYSNKNFGPLAFLPKHFNFVSEGIIANGLWHISPTRSTLIVLEGQKNGFLNIGEFPILGRRLTSEHFVFSTIDTKGEVDIDYPEGFSLLLSYLIVIQNIEQVSVLVLREEDCDGVLSSLDTEFFQQHNLLLCGDLQQGNQKGRNAEDDFVTLEAVRAGKIDKISSHNSLLKGFVKLMKEHHFSLINERYLNTGALQLQELGTGMCALNAG